MARTRKRTRSPKSTSDQKSVKTARELSVQARATQEGSWGSGGLLTYLTQAGQLIAPWWSPRRDADLDAFWKKSDHLSGALALLAARVATVPLRVLPRDSTVKAHLRQAEDFTIRLTEESEFGQAWTDTICKWLADYWCLAGPTRIHLGGERRGQTKAIAKMVKDKDTGPVLSVTKEGYLVERQVTEWFKNPLGNRRWWWLSLEEASFHSRDQRGGIFVTEDHPILTENGWLPAREVESDMMVATGDPVPNELQSQLLVGTLLGDASMSFVRKRAMLRFGHSVKQEKWLDLKLLALQGFHWTGRNHRVSKIGLNESEVIGINSRASLGLNSWHEAFYPDGKKIVPRDLVKENFSSLMLAAWYLDDGSLHQVETTTGNLIPQVTLYTNSFSESDVQWLADLLTSQEIPSKMRINRRPRDGGKSYPVIAIGAEGSRKLMELIGSFVPPSMRYKVTEDAPDYDLGFWELGSARVYWDRVAVSKQRDFRTGSSYYDKRPAETTYNLSVEGTETFVAAQTVVHNCSDNGGFWEVIGEGKQDGPIVGPAQGLSCLDSFHCVRTGDIEFPVLYRDTSGKPSKLHRTRVAFASDMPSSRVEMRGVGFCALSRAINVSQNLQDISIFKQEKLGSRPVRGILLGKGIHTSVVTGSLEVADEIMDNQGLARLAKLPIIGDIATDADLSLLSLSGLPDGFDEETSTRLGMFAIALAFGVPIRWIWPAATSGATKADAMYQHIAGLGGGIGKVLSIITMLLGGDPRGSRHSAGKFLPPHLKLVFDFQDDEQDRMKADISKVRTEARSKSLADGVINSRVAREQALESGDLSQSQFNQLELDDGRLPDGSDVLSLFTSVDDIYLRLLDLGVREPLALHANDPFIILEEVDLAALNAQNIIGSGRTAGERQKAREALAALGKLKTIYAPEAQRETEQEMQAEVTAEVQEGEEEVAEGEKGFASGFDFSVPVGEVITGELARGAGGRFVNVAQLKEQLRAGMLARRARAGEAAESKPSAAAAAKAANTAAVAEALGMPPGSLDALTVLRSGGDAGDVSDLVGRGFVKLGMDGQPIMTTLGRSMLSAGNSGDVDKARAAIDKDAEKKTRAEGKERDRQAKQAVSAAKKREREAERERKRLEKEAAREREKQERELQRETEAATRDIERMLELESNHSEAAQALGSRGVREEDFNGLMTFRDGASLDAASAQRLAASGLVELDPEGNPRLTTDGRAVMSAADSGDTRRVLDEMSQARERVVGTLDKAEVTREKASDARDKAADYRADAEKLDADADAYETKADGYETEADEFDTEADGFDAEVAELVAAGADSVDIEKAEANATKARERAEKKREQAEAKREQASKKLERAADKRKSATDKDADAVSYDEDARDLVDKVGGGAWTETRPQSKVGPGGEAPEPEEKAISRVPESSGESETIEHGLSGRVKAMVQGAMGALLGRGEKQKVEPRGEPLKPFTKDEVPISDEDIDAATVESKQAQHTFGIVAFPCPVCNEHGAKQYRDHKGLCVCGNCGSTFDPSIEL